VKSHQAKGIMANSESGSERKQPKDIICENHNKHQQAPK